MSFPAIHRVPRGAALLLALAAVVGCGSPVEWGEPAPAGTAPDAVLALDAAGTPRFVADSTTLPPPTAPSPTLCAGSLRTAPLARGARRVLTAVWWEPRADGSARLLAAESPDGGRTWPTRAPVDTLDRATLGCNRPAPAIATDSASGYAHVAYALWAPEGAGVFFAHTMPGHFMFHTPVSVAYGERPGRVAVAASGDRVAVAYEDPSARTPRIGLGLSRTQGHVFEQLGIDPAGPGAAAPRVALRGPTVAVAWTSVPAAAAASAGVAARTLVRVGRVGE